MTSSIDTKHSPALPSASVLVLRETAGLEVLMVQRSNRGMFANALVFPGGVLEPSDVDDDWTRVTRGGESLTPSERGLRIAAIREVYEETGLLLAQETSPHNSLQPPPVSAEFLRHLEIHKTKLDLDKIVSFSNWVTPFSSPKRYDTYFYLARFSGDSIAICDGTETVRLEWVRPTDLLERHDREEIDLLLATKGNLELLAQATSIDHAFEQAMARHVEPVIPERREIKGVDCVTVPPGTPFGGLSIPTERIFRRRTG